MVLTRSQAKKKRGAVREEDKDGSHETPAPKGSSQWQRVAIVLAIFGAFAAFVWLMWKSLLPPMEGIKMPPRSLQDAQILGKELGQYVDSHYYQVIAVYLSTYIFLQTFAIPGSIFLSILSGALFWFPVALFLVCLSAAVGASLANQVSFYVGRELVERNFGARLKEWRKTVNKQRDNLFNYMLFLRITPLVPNFFVNIASPLVHFPLKTFFVGTFIGVSPPSILFIRLGALLQELTTEQTRLGVSTFVGLIAMGFLSLLPVFYRDWFSKKLLKTETSEKSL